MGHMEIENPNGAKMSFRCIGQKRIRRHPGDRGELVQCANESESPSLPGRPEFGFLCLSCSGAAPLRPAAIEESTNVGAMQCDAAELRDAAESGFKTGMYESDRVGEE